MIEAGQIAGALLLGGIVIAFAWFAWKSTELRDPDDDE